VIYLSGAVKPHYKRMLPGEREDEYAQSRRWGVHNTWQGRTGIGFLHTPDMGNSPVPGAVWAADNGCFKDPDNFDLHRYIDWLAQRDRESCLFATAPDWPPQPGLGLTKGDWSCTIDRYPEGAAPIRGLGYPVALVAQDGFEHYLDRVLIWFASAIVDALFIGGSTEWKLSGAAAECVQEARRWGLWVHMGRVNSGKRLRIAADMGCDSADGTYLAFTGPKGLPQVCDWLDGVNVPLGARQAA